MSRERSLTRARQDFSRQDFPRTDRFYDRPYVIFARGNRATNLHNALHVRSANVVTRLDGAKYGSYSFGNERPCTNAQAWSTLIGTRAFFGVYRLPLLFAIIRHLAESTRKINLDGWKTREMRERERERAPFVRRAEYRAEYRVKLLDSHFNSDYGNIFSIGCFVLSVCAYFYLARCREIRGKAVRAVTNSVHPTRRYTRGSTVYIASDLISVVRRLQRPMHRL